jgi:hypothetical protein
MEEVPWYVSLAVSWLPFILWILILIWFARMLSRLEGCFRSADGRPVGQVLDEYVREMRRSNELLEQTIRAQSATPGDS